MRVACWKISSPASAHGLNDFSPSWTKRLLSISSPGDTRHSEKQTSPKWQSPEIDLQCLRSPCSSRFSSQGGGWQPQLPCSLLANSAHPSGTRDDGCSQSPESLAHPSKQAQPQAQTAKSLSTLRVSGRPVQALTLGPFQFLGFLHKPCV